MVEISARDRRAGVDADVGAPVVGHVFDHAARPQIDLERVARGPRGERARRAARDVAARDAGAADVEPRVLPVGADLDGGRRVHVDHRVEQRRALAHGELAVVLDHRAGDVAARGDDLRFVAADGDVLRFTAREMQGARDGHAGVDPAALTHDAAAHDTAVGHGAPDQAAVRGVIVPDAAVDGHVFDDQRFVAGAVEAEHARVAGDGHARGGPRREEDVGILADGHVLDDAAAGFHAELEAAAGVAAVDRAARRYPDLRRAGRGGDVGADIVHHPVLGDRDAAARGDDLIDRAARGVNERRPRTAPALRDQVERAAVNVHPAARGDQSAVDRAARDVKRTAGNDGVVHRALRDAESGAGAVYFRALGQTARDRVLRAGGDGAVVHRTGLLDSVGAIGRSVQDGDVPYRAAGGAGLAADLEPRAAEGAAVHDAVGKDVEVDPVVYRDVLDRAAVGEELDGAAAGRDVPGDAAAVDVNGRLSAAEDDREPVHLRAAAHGQVTGGGDGEIGGGGVILEDEVLRVRVLSGLVDVGDGRIDQLAGRQSSAGSVFGVGVFSHFFDPFVF